MNIFKKIRIDISNFRFVRSFINREYNSSKWQECDIERDFGNFRALIWSVVSIEESDINEDNLFKSYKIRSKISDINKYLSDNNLGELLNADISKKSDNSFLVVYTPKFHVININKLLSGALTTALILSLPTIAALAALLYIFI